MSKWSDQPDLRYSLVIKYLESREPGIVKKAYGEFCDLVEPSFDRLSGDDKKRVRELSSEWLVFDRVFEDGMTGLQAYCRANPDHRGRGFIRNMEESGENQFSSMFWVEGLDRAGCDVYLQDAATGCRFLVHDVALSSSLPAGIGMLFTRLTSVSGTWCLPGNVVGYFPIEPSEKMKQEALDTPGVVPRTFVGLARQAFHRTIPKEDLPVFPKVAQPNVADPEELARFREDVERRFHAFAERYPLPLTWEELASTVLHEDGTTMPHILMGRLFGDATAGFANQNDLAEFCCIWSDAWNSLPHELIGGLCPWEKMIEGSEGGALL